MDTSYYPVGRLRHHRNGPGEWLKQICTPLLYRLELYLLERSIRSSRIRRDHGFSPSYSHEERDGEYRLSSLWGSFRQRSSSGWTTYGGAWSIAFGVSTDTNVGYGNKSVASVSNSGNLVMQSDVQMTGMGPSANAEIVLEISNPSMGADAYNGFYLGAAASA